MKKTALTSLLLVSFLFIFSQTDREKFEKTFNQEINQADNIIERENHSAFYQYVPPQMLPEWCFQPLISNTNEVYAIGISDPGLDTVISTNQAIYRAQIIANILHKSKTQLLCDFFLNEEDKSTSIVYEHFSRITSKIPEDYKNYTLINSYRNSYDETLVLIKYTAPKKSELKQADDILMEFYKNETESSSFGELESIYELQVKSSPPKVPVFHFYQLTEFGSRFDVISSANGTESQVPIYTLCYTGIPSLDSVNQYYFSHGLWKEYYKSIVAQIIQNARAKPENIKFLGDAYQKTSYQKLTRGVSINTQRFAITGIKAKDNTLMVEMQELPVEK